MGGDAVELTVRFAGTLVAVERVAPGEVERAMRALTGGVRNGLVTIETTRVTARPIVLPRVPVQLRVVPYVLAALVVHVAVLVIAMWNADLDPITIPVVHAPPTRVPTKTLPVKPPPPPKRPKPQRAQQPQVAGTTQDVPAQPLAQAIEGARNAGMFGSLTPERMAKLTGKKDLAKELADVGPVYDERAANAQGFGNAGGSFDPSNDPAFDSVKVGPLTFGGGRMGQGYRLPAHGKFREVARPPIMGLTCDDDACKTVGSLDRLAVRDHVEKRYVDFVTCYERHAKGALRIELTLHFEIGRDGRPTEVHADGGTRFGRCVVKLVEQHVRFPTDQPTRVTYPIAFWRT